MVSISLRCGALVVAFALLVTTVFGQGGVRSGDRTDGQEQMMPPGQMQQDRTMPRRPGFTRMTTEQVAQELGQWIQRDIALKGGKFLIFDPVTSMPLILNFTAVEKEKVNQASQNAGNWTAAVDFTTPEGSVRTVYFRVRPIPIPERERIFVTAISLVPVDGTGATPTPEVTPMETPIGTPIETPIATPMETPVVPPDGTPVETPVEPPMGGAGGGM